MEIHFDIGSSVEAVDSCGIWSRGEVAERNGDGAFLVKFDGYGPRYHRLVDNMSEIREPTPSESKLHQTRSIMSRLESGDSVWIKSDHDGPAIPIEASVCIIDNFMMQVQVELPDGEKQLISAHQLCDPPAPEPKKPTHRQGQHNQAKARSAKQVPTETMPSQLEEDTPLITSKFVECNVETIPHLFVLRPSDGLKLQIGNIVKAEHYNAPLMIVELWQKCNAILAKLSSFDISSSTIVSDFNIQCDVKYISMWDGEKLKTKSVAEKVYNIASTQFFLSLKSNDSPALRICYRTVLLGKIFRDNVHSGFSNLNSTRFSLGPYDVFCDGIIFGFGVGSSRKFSLLEDGDFAILDAIMGGKWDIKLGKDLDSFFKFAIVVEVTRNNDFVLYVNVKFSEAKFIFCDDYRKQCKIVIIEKKQEMANVGMH